MLLYRACSEGHADLAQLLFDHGANKLQLQRSIFDTLSTDETLLHRAVTRHYDARIVDIIIAVDPSLCSIRNKSGQLPVETILVDESGEDLPFNLMSRIIEAMSPSLIEEAISEKSTSFSNQQHQQRYTDFRILSCALKRIKTVRSINVHLIGDGYAGKTTIRSAFRHTLTDPSMFYDLRAKFTGTRNAKVDKIPLDDRTVGCEIEVIEFGWRRWRLFDYGGLEKFHANHNRFLRLAGSLYVIVIPLLDFSKPQPVQFQPEHIVLRYRYWLRFLASISCKHESLEIVSVLNGKSLVSSEFIQYIQTLILDEQKRWIENEKATIKLKSGGSEIRKLIFDCAAIHCIDNRQQSDVRRALNSILIETVDRAQRNAKFIPNISSIYENLKDFEKDNNRWPTFISVHDFKESKIATAIDEISKPFGQPSDKLKEFLKGWMVQRLEDFKEIIMMEGWVLTDTTRSVFGQIIAKHEKSSEQKCLLEAKDVIASIGNSTIHENHQPCIHEDILMTFLESIGACVKVNLADNEKYYFPMVKALVDSTKETLCLNLKDFPDSLGKQIKRRFTLNDKLFTCFPPGYFENLFAEIVAFELNRLSKIQFIATYENAFILKYEWRELQMETVVIAEEDMFIVTISLLTKYQGIMREDFNLSDEAESRVRAICDLVYRKNFPPVTGNCIHPDEPKTGPLETVLELLDNDGR